MEWFEPLARAAVARRFGCPPDAARIALLAAHASSRTYWRVTVPGDPPRTLVLMVLNPEDRGIKSDEIVEIEAGTRELPFLNVQRFLRAFTDAVPEVYLHDEANGLVYLEDLGDTLFESVVAPAGDRERRAWYARAIDLMVLLQTEGTRRLDEACIASRAAFTETLLTWELEHFIEYGLGTKLGVDVPPGDLAALRRAFKPLAAAIAAEPRVFTHRDFQSKNLLVQGPAGRAGAAASSPRDARIRLIDFQDALQGPRVYDLVALLRDSYVELSDAVVEASLDHYLDRARAAGFPGEPDALRALFARVTLQRKLKDYGRFVYIQRVKGNAAYLRYNPANARYIVAAARRLPELGDAEAVLRRALGPEAEKRP
jgi:aminoglycoside/choline kinase family phosphotransferase